MLVYYIMGFITLTYREVTRSKKYIKRKMENFE